MRLELAGTITVDGLKEPGMPNALNVTLAIDPKFNASNEIVFLLPAQKATFGARDWIKMRGGIGVG